MPADSPVLISWCWTDTCYFSDPHCETVWEFCSERKNAEGGGEKTRAEGDFSLDEVIDDGISFNVSRV
ncbi:hypothetical protein DPEC_G00020990 [Dallia pectoralis]|uniref:Uncharacterized protein n=1 Tax=Dallia pectoralis TaxID=75939 RepID=A0ACC2HG96_DALPE|nr:hypothetical protein DPEC_G00020990 [Dallia pectoralis]